MPKGTLLQSIVFAVWLKTYYSNLHRLTALVGNQTLGNLLLEFDADIDAQNAEGATALILAIKAPAQKWLCLFAFMNRCSRVPLFSQVHQLEFADFMLESDADCPPSKFKGWSGVLMLARGHAHMSN